MSVLQDEGETHPRERLWSGDNTSMSASSKIICLFQCLFGHFCFVISFKIHFKHKFFGKTNPSASPDIVGNLVPFFIFLFLMMQGLI